MLLAPHQDRAILAKISKNNADECVDLWADHGEAHSPINTVTNSFQTATPDIASGVVPGPQIRVAGHSAGAASLEITVTGFACQVWWSRRSESPACAGGSHLGVPHEHDQGRRVQCCQTGGQS